MTNLCPCLETLGIFSTPSRAHLGTRSLERYVLAYVWFVHLTSSFNRSNLDMSFVFLSTPIIPECSSCGSPAKGIAITGRARIFICSLLEGLTVVDETFSPLFYNMDFFPKRLCDTMMVNAWFPSFTTYSIAHFKMQLTLIVERPI